MFPFLIQRRTSLAPIMSAVVLTLVSFSAIAQTAGTASVQGTVTDPSGAAVPNASVKLTQTDTGAARETTTDASGLYSLPNVPVGPYSLTVSAQGFAGFTQRGVLEVGNNAQINPSLKIGTEAQQIEVRASGAVIETETSSFKQVVDQERITEMPLNGRQATQLVLVSGAAVTAPTGDLVGSKNYASSTVIAVAGGQGNYNNYVLDGGTNVDVFTNVTCRIRSRMRCASFRSSPIHCLPETGFTPVHW